MTGTAIQLVGGGGFREFMLEINIDGLEDDSSWRRLGALLHEVAVSDQQLATIRARLMARLYDGEDVSDDALDRP